MSASDARFSRNEALFGADGQRLLSASSVGIVGLGGLGSHVVQQLAYAGVQTFALVDPDRVEPSNLNRLIGATEGDAYSNLLKTSVAERAIKQVQPNASVTEEASPLGAQPDRVDGLDVVFGCVDSDSVRLELITACALARVPFFDLATDTGGGADRWYGGRVLFSGRGERCPACMDLLDQRALRAATQTPAQRQEDERIYGVASDVLDGTGPAVVSLNGVVASLAVTEFIKWRTGLATPAGLLTYRGESGVVRLSSDEPDSECYYCSLWATSEAIAS